MMAAQDRYQTFIDDQREIFDAMVTEDWNTYYSKSWDETRRFEISRSFNVAQPSSILDIGRGCGFHDREIAVFSFVERVGAFDCAKMSVERANHTYPHPKVRRWVGDLLTDMSPERYGLVVTCLYYVQTR